MHNESIAIAVFGLLFLFSFKEKIDNVITDTQENQNTNSNMGSGSQPQEKKCDDVKIFDPKNNDVKTYDYNVII